MTWAGTVVAPAWATSAGADSVASRSRSVLLSVSGLARLDQHVGEDRDGVAPFDDAMDVAQRLEQGGSLDGDLHRIILNLTPARRFRDGGARAAPLASPSSAARRSALSRGGADFAKDDARTRKGDGAAVPSESAEFAPMRSTPGNLNRPLNRRL